jgi:hypothetical protein
VKKPAVVLGLFLGFLGLASPAHAEEAPLLFVVGKFCQKDLMAAGRFGNCVVTMDFIDEGKERTLLRSINITRGKEAHAFSVGSHHIDTARVRIDNGKIYIATPRSDKEFGVHFPAEEADKILDEMAKGRTLFFDYGPGSQLFEVPLSGYQSIKDVESTTRTEAPVVRGRVVW